MEELWDGSWALALPERELWMATLETGFPSELPWGEESSNLSLGTADAC